MNGLVPSVGAPLNNRFKLPIFVRPLHQRYAGAAFFHRLTVIIHWVLGIPFLGVGARRAVPPRHPGAWESLLKKHSEGGGKIPCEHIQNIYNLSIMIMYISIHFTLFLVCALNVFAESPIISFYLDVVIFLPNINAVKESCSGFLIITLVEFV